MTRTPLRAWRSAKSRESESSADFATEYSGIAAEGRLPAVEQTLTIRPQPRSAIAGAAARIARSGAITLISYWARQSSSGTSSRSRHRAEPALLTRTSRAPKLSLAAASIRSPASSAVTSSASASARPPASAPAVAGLLGRLGEGVGAAGDEQDRRPLGAELAGGLAADAAAGAGDDAAPAADAEVHQSASTR